jgi:GntP family gluconate:H+ symporter
MQQNAIAMATQGAGRVFALLAIPIFSGSLIALVIRQENFAQRIVSDMQKISSRPTLTSAIAGYLLSIPLMCCLTAYVVMIPLVENLKVNSEIRKKCYYATAIGSTLSFVLLYPLPVMYSITRSLNFNVDAGFNLAAITISIILFIFGYLLISKRGSHKDRWKERELTGKESPIGWIPLMLPIIFLTIGHFLPGASLLADINLAIIIAASASLLLVKKENLDVIFEKGTRNAGIILLDLCGAGALGGVIAASSFAENTYNLIGHLIPALFIPFLFAAIIQTAQGSRAVTAIITSSILAYSPYVSEVAIIPLILMISAGTMVFSYVTDPFFWLIQRTTGDDVKTVVSSYTIPLAMLGILLFISVLLLDYFLF